MPKKYTTEEVEEFLRESNAIEGVRGADPLQQAKVAWGYLISRQVLDVGVILKTHKILMVDQPLQPSERGYFRNTMVYVNGKPMLNAVKIPQAMSDWLVTHGTMNMEDGIKNAHIAFEKIHPFADGNGRIGRMIMNWQRVKNKLPVLIIHEGEEQMEYYKWFLSKSDV